MTLNDFGRLRFQAELEVPIWKLETNRKRACTPEPYALPIYRLQGSLRHHRPMSELTLMSTPQHHPGRCHSKRGASKGVIGYIGTVVTSDNDIRN